METYPLSNPNSRRATLTPRGSRDQRAPASGSEASGARIATGAAEPPPPARRVYLRNTAEEHPQNRHDTRAPANAPEAPGARIATGAAQPPQQGGQATSTTPEEAAEAQAERERETAPPPVPRPRQGWPASAIWMQVEDLAGADEPLRGEFVVVTGDLDTLPREEANRCLSDMGAVLQKEVTRATTLLAIGPRLDGELPPFRGRKGSAVAAAIDAAGDMDKPKLVELTVLKSARDRRRSHDSKRPSHQPDSGPHKVVSRSPSNPRTWQASTMAMGFAPTAEQSAAGTGTPTTGRLDH